MSTAPLSPPNPPTVPLKDPTFPDRFFTFLAGIPAWAKSRSGRIVIGILVAAFMLLLGVFPDKSSSTATALWADSKLPEPAALVSARLDTNRIAHADTHTLEVRVLNRGATDITGLNLQLLAPGFEIDSSKPFTCNGQAPIISSSAQPTGALKLPPQTSCLFSIPLVPLARSGSYNIGAEVAWLQASSQTMRLKLGPIRLDGWFSADTLQRFGRRLAQLFKDLTIPLLLLLLTTQLGIWQKDREEARIASEAVKEQIRLKAERTKQEADEAKLREEEQKREDQERKRSEENQVRRLLLEKVTTLAETYYLNIASAGKGILDAHADLDAKLETSTDRLFFQTMLLVHYITLLKENHGGVFFAERDPEEIFAKAWAILKMTLFAVVGEDQIDVATTLLQKDRDFAVFQPEIPQMKGSISFAEWQAGANPVVVASHATLREFLPVVDVLQSIAHFEASVPLNRYWYKTAPALRFLSASLTIPGPARFTAAQIKAAATLPTLFKKYWKARENPQTFD